MRFRFSTLAFAVVTSCQTPAQMALRRALTLMTPAVAAATTGREGIARTRPIDVECSDFLARAMIATKEARRQWNNALLSVQAMTHNDIVCFVVVARCNSKLGVAIARGQPIRCKGNRCHNVIITRTANISIGICVSLGNCHVAK